MSSMSGTNATSLDEARADAEATRAELGGTVAALADKADVKKRTREAASRTAAQVRQQAGYGASELRQKADEVRGAARRNPGRLAAAGAGVLAVSGAVAGVLVWRRVRRTPVGRTAQVWSVYRIWRAVAHRSD